MKNLIFSVITIILLNSNCSKEIEFKQQSIEKKLVLNGFICPDSLISVNVRRTIGILSNESSIVENATVSLYKNNKFIENLEYISKGNYKSSSIFPQVDSIYTVKVELESYPTIFASDTIPKQTPIINGTKTTGNTYDEYGDPHHDYEFEFSDALSKNYYELFFIQQTFPYQYDSLYWIYFQIGLEVADPVLKSDSELDTNPYTYIFSDRYFNGKIYKMKNKFRAAVCGGEFKAAFAPTEKDNYVILRTTSLVYFNYRKYWIRHKYNQQEGDVVEYPLFSIFIGTPVDMYSNVENGYGIFAAYNQTYFKLKVINIPQK